jgi:hypothetical protein
VNQDGFSKKLRDLNHLHDLVEGAFENSKANTGLCHSICRMVSQCFKLCSKHGGSHFEQFL